MFRKLVAALALLGGLAVAAPALAASAHTTGNVNVRSGPGTGYAKLGTLTAGTRVKLRGCEDNWCSVRGAGPYRIGARLDSLCPVKVVS